MRQKQIGTMTRDEITSQIRALTLRNLDAGMEMNEAVRKAGEEFRSIRAKQADTEFAAIERFLGIKPHDQQKDG